MALTIQEIDPAVNPSLREIESKTGPSNFFRMMAHSPAAMQDFAALEATVMGPGSIDRRFKEVLCLAVSFVNECAYCIARHTDAAIQLGISDAEIFDVKSETNQRFSPKEQAALHYARELTRTGAADTETRDAIQNLFSAQQLVELTMVIALANFSNRFSNGLTVPVEKREKHRTAS